MGAIGWLFLYAGLLGWVGDSALSRARWTTTAPRLGLWVWHATAAGVLLALSWAMVLLAHDVMEHGFASLFDADKTRLHLAYAPETEVPSYWNATIIVLVVGFVACLATAVRRARAERAATASHDVAVSTHLPVTTTDGAEARVGVCKSHLPLIYCVPGGPASERIRVTTAALDLLQREELLAAIDHEQAHIRGRHHLQILLADSVVAALRWSRLLRHYPGAVRDLVEYQADDHAVAHHGTHTVAGALLTMSAPGQAAAPTTTAWTGGTPAARIRRLLFVPRRPRTAVRAACASAVVLLPLLPSAAAVAPAVAVANTESVPHTTDFAHHP